MPLFSGKMMSSVFDTFEFLSVSLVQSKKAINIQTMLNKMAATIKNTRPVRCFSRLSGAAKTDDGLNYILRTHIVKGSNQLLNAVL